MPKIQPPKVTTNYTVEDALIKKGKTIFRKVGELKYFETSPVSGCILPMVEELSKDK